MLFLATGGAAAERAADFWVDCDAWSPASARTVCSETSAAAAFGFLAWFPRMYSVLYSLHPLPRFFLHLELTIYPSLVFKLSQSGHTSSPCSSSLLCTRCVATTSGRSPSVKPTSRVACPLPVPRRRSIPRTRPARSPELRTRTRPSPPSLSRRHPRVSSPRFEVPLSCVSPAWQASPLRASGVRINFFSQVPRVRTVTCYRIPSIA